MSKSSPLSAATSPHAKPPTSRHLAWGLLRSSAELLMPICRATSALQARFVRAVPITPIRRPLGAGGFRLGREALETPS